jgi:hypothetical protein
MSNVKNKRTGLKFLGGNYQRFTMNKTQQNQPVYSNIQPRCPGPKGRRGQTDCAGPDTRSGCQSCPGFTYSFDVSLNAWMSAFPSYGNFASVNLIVDSIANTPCEWQYNAIVEEFTIDAFNTTVTLSIEKDSRVNVNDIAGVYFYAPVGGNTGIYTGDYKDCAGDIVSSNYPINNILENEFIKTANRVGAPYRNPIAGWRKSLNCDYRACTDTISSSATSSAARQPTQTIYKDNYSGSQSDRSGCCPKDCSNNIVYRKGVQGRTHRPIIRSGMQEKKYCCKTSSGKCNKKNDYSFSYRQYQNNSRCLSYERSLEKNVGRYPCKGSDGKCLNKFSKSGCAGCCICCTTEQMMKLESTVLLAIGSTITQGDITGEIIAIESGNSGSGPPYLYKIKIIDSVSNTCSGLKLGTAFDNKKQPVTIVNIKTAATKSSGGDCGNKSNNVTIYKPNNKKFSKQGAVSSGSRLDRLKLDTIRASNSKCIKGQRCKIIPSKFIDGGSYKVPNGKYDAGNPRFTGWMFNGHHGEIKGRVYNMVRYNQQPLGIPQLTAHRVGKTCVKECFPRTLDLPSDRSTAAGNRARIPGSKCSNKCNKCPNCNNLNDATGQQGLPCCN